MTDRLKHLIDGEVDALDVPPPAVDAVLTRGLRMRRHRRLTTGAVGIVAAAVVCGGAYALSTGSGGKGAAPDPAGATATGAVYAIDNAVYLEDGARSATIPDKAVKSLYYTSAGVLVRHGVTSGSDGGGPQRFSLVSDDGSISAVSVETEETVHATDPAQPLLAYAQAVDGKLVVFVRDVSTDEEVARVPVTATRDSWFPVSLSGDHVFVQNGYDGVTYAVDWRSGEVAESDVVEHGMGVAGGHAVLARNGASVVVDALTGGELFALPGKGWATLSPDGRFAAVNSEDYIGDEPRTTVVYDVATGSQITVASSWGWGWTPDGDLFAINADQGVLTTCDPSSGDCVETPADLPPVPEEVCHTETHNGGTASWCEGGTLEVILGGTIRES